MAIDANVNLWSSSANKLAIHFAFAIEWFSHYNSPVETGMQSVCKKLIILFCFHLWLIVVATQPLASEVPAAITWIDKSAARGPMSPEDERSRDTLLQLINEKADRTFRANCKVSVPAHATGLPRRYDIKINGIGFDVQQLNIQVRDDCAQLNLLSGDGIYQYTLPADSLDGLVRQMIFAFLSSEEWDAAPPKINVDQETSRSTAHSAVANSVEILSCDLKHPLHLQTPWWSFNTRDIRHATEGVRGFTFSRLRGAIAASIAELHGEMVRPTPEMQRNLLAQLQLIPTPKIDSAKREVRPNGEEGKTHELTKEAQWSFECPGQEDRLAFDARLLAQLAVAWRCVDTMPELRRLKMDRFAERLSIVTAGQDDGLVAALMDKEPPTFNWALNYTRTLPPARSAAVYSAVLPKLNDENRAVLLLAHLESTKPRREELTVVHSLYVKTASPSIKISCAAILLGATRDLRYADCLSQLAKSSTDKQGDIMISVRAVTILSAYSEQESDFKLLPLVRDLLDQHPDEWIMTLTLIDILAHKGDRADISRLLKYCDHVSYAHLATVGLARLNVLLALEKCRKQIDRFGRLSKVAGWDYMLLVSPYLDLIFWQGDRTLVPSLELALAQMRKIADDDPVLMTDQLSLLIRYLDTDSMDQRAQLASRFVQRYHSDPQGWIREVHTKLTAAGADAELCKSLILPRPIRTHGGGLLSGDLEPQ